MELTIELTDIGEGIDSGLVTTILPKKGEAINEGDTLIEIETDKAVIPFPAPQSGTLSEFFIEEGVEIKVGDKIAKIIGIDAASPEPPASVSPPEVSAEKADSVAVESQPASAPPPEAVRPPSPTPPPTTPPPSPAPEPSYTNVPASPATRKLARELGVNLKEVTGSGRKGRVIMDDLKAFVHTSLNSPSTAVSGGASVSDKPLPDFSEFGQTEVKKMSRLREVISKNMQLSWATIPHVHHNSRFNISVVTKWQKQYHSQFKERGSTLSVTPVLIKALAQAIKEFPVFNTSFNAATSELHYKHFYNIGVAVDTEAGLIVPVIKNVDQLTVFEIGKKLRDLAKQTRERRVGLKDLSGACTTLSNLGGIGGTEHFNPIINPPEVSILGTGRTIQEVHLKDGVPSTIPMLPVTLGYDHRVIDGAVAARFLLRLKHLVEEPEMLLMGIDLS